ncbi:hypothetical protein SLE2022_218660 [Rubroshorea leprosula]
MEISVINRISDLEVGLNSLPDPSFVSQLFALPGTEKIYQGYNFWKWGALILALLASFTTIVNRIKILIVRLKHRSSLPSPVLLQDTDFDTETDTSCYSSSDDEQEKDTPSTSRDWRWVDENFQVRGSSHVIDDRGQKRLFTLRRRCGSIGDLFSLSELVAGGKSVVKLWDNLGLRFGLDFDDGDETDGFNLYDINQETKISSFPLDKCGVQAVSHSSYPAVVVSAGANLSGKVSLSAWDTRLPPQASAILAEWQPKSPAEKIAAVNAGRMEKVYVEDDVTGELTVGDMRKVSSPVANATESSNLDTWWDADAVIVSNESS